MRFFIHAALFRLELLCRRAARLAHSAPIFIIGAPRSGTSLLYEMMITRFHFAYISNLAHRFYFTPLAASVLGKAPIGKWTGQFTSRFGHIAGWGAPNEGGWVWRRWLQDGDWRGDIICSKADARGLRLLTDGLSTIFTAPFLNKNVMHSNRLKLMRHIWPEALFIHVTRDVTDNVRSIVRAERKEGGPAHDGDHWWSVRPAIAPAYIGQSDVTRATAQVIGIEQDIMRDMQEIGARHIFSIDYADLCRDPHGTIAAIEAFLKDRAIPLRCKNSIPTKFSPPLSKPLDADDEAKIIATCHEARATALAHRF